MSAKPSGKGKIPRKQNKKKVRNVLRAFPGHYKKEDRMNVVSKDVKFITGISNKLNTNAHRLRVLISQLRESKFHVNQKEISKLERILEAIKSELHKSKVLEGELRTLEPAFRTVLANENTKAKPTSSGEPVIKVFKSKKI